MPLLSSLCYTRIDSGVCLIYAHIGRLNCSFSDMSLYRNVGHDNQANKYKCRSYRHHVRCNADRILAGFDRGRKDLRTRCGKQYTPYRDSCRYASNPSPTSQTRICSDAPCSRIRRETSKSCSIAPQPMRKPMLGLVRCSPSRCSFESSGIDPLYTRRCLSSSLIDSPIGRSFCLDSQRNRCFNKRNYHYY